MGEEGEGEQVQEARHSPPLLRLPKHLQEGTEQTDSQVAEVSKCGNDQLEETRKGNQQHDWVYG